MWAVACCANGAGGCHGIELRICWLQRYTQKSPFRGPMARFSYSTHRTPRLQDDMACSGSNCATSGTSRRIWSLTHITFPSSKSTSKRVTTDAEDDGDSPKPVVKAAVRPLPPHPPLPLRYFTTVDPLLSQL